MSLQGNQRAMPVFLSMSFVLHLAALAFADFDPAKITTRYLGQPQLNAHLLTANDLVVRTTSRSRGIKQAVEKQVTALQSKNAVVHDTNDEFFPMPTAAGNNEVNETPNAKIQRARIRNHLLGLLHTRLSRFLVYPTQARQRGWQGTVLLGLRVESDGQLDNIRVERGSGYAVLDRSAVKSMKRMGHLAEATTHLNGRGIEMQLPVIYRLIDN